MKPIIAITQGEARGIGPEIIIKALQKPSIFKLCTPIIIGEAKYFKPLQKKVLILPPLASHTSCYGALKHAALLCLENKASAFVTAPVDKHEITQKEGVRFTGHTEFLKNMCERYFKRPFHPTMFFVSPKERIALVTTHLALKNVSKALSPELLRKTIFNVHAGLQSLFQIPNPKLALLGLNPHAGEGGLLGKEEETILKPALQWAHRQNIHLSGPYAADSFFVDRWRFFDATLALYHDQGLTPFKARNFHSSTNVTLGLPLIRTSVDHGVGYDISGKNKANPLSMQVAIEWAAKLAKRRKNIPWEM